MKALMTLLIMSASISLYGQTTTTLTTNQVDIKTGFSSEWTEYFSNSEISIEYKFTDCDPSKGLDNESVLLKITNLTSDKMEVYWMHQLYYNGDCLTCEHTDEYTYSYFMGPNEVLQGDCEYTSDKQLRIFSKFIDAAYDKGAILTAFKLDELTIKTF